VRQDEAIRAIAEPRRREILRVLLAGELAAGAVADRFRDVTRPAVSQHLRVLREAGLVTERRDGTRRLYRADPVRIARLRAYLDAFWGDRLESLRLGAEDETRRRRSGGRHVDRRS
jgi:DNA-binding transcriptional ArsR family regulator